MEALNESAPINFTLPHNFGKRPTDLALSVILVFMLLIIMLSLGCTMEFGRIRAHFRKPKGLAIALVAQYGIMPLTAFALGKLFRLNNVEALAILICGCSPGGNLSNIFALQFLQGRQEFPKIFQLSRHMGCLLLTPPICPSDAGTLPCKDTARLIPEFPSARSGSQVMMGLTSA